jgi:hypothetical protein
VVVASPAQEKVAFADVTVRIIGDVAAREVVAIPPPPPPPEHVVVPKSPLLFTVTQTVPLPAKYGINRDHVAFTGTNSFEASFHKLPETCAEASKGERSKKPAAIIPRYFFILTLILNLLKSRL